MKNKIQEGIPLIKEWIEIKRKEFQNNTDFNELIRVVKEIEKDGDYKVEKINDKEIKIIDKNPVNPFKGSNAEDLPEFIKQQMESKDFSPYRYRCTIK